jgi:hypothetical protein
MMKGRLPTIDEWFMAARGSSPRRFAWGDDVTDCNQHVMAGQLMARKQGKGPSLNGAIVSACSETVIDTTVAAHTGGKAPSGVEDVLLSPGELVAGQAEGVLAACSDPSRGCVVTGLEPAAIDSVEPFYEATGEDGAHHLIVAHAYGFRCVVDGK